MHSSKLKKLKFLLFDLHGVILENENSGYNPGYLDSALSKLKGDLATAARLNLGLGIISATEDHMIIARLKDLGIEEILTHSIDKVSQAEKLLRTQNLSYEEIAYIGDDILDLPLLAKVGFSATTRKARHEVKRAVNYIIRNDESKTVLYDILALIEKAKYGRMQ